MDQRFIGLSERCSSWGLEVCFRQDSLCSMYFFVLCYWTIDKLYNIVLCQTKSVKRWLATSTENALFIFNLYGQAVNLHISKVTYFVFGFFMNFYLVKSFPFQNLNKWQVRKIPFWTLKFYVEINIYIYIYTCIW